MKGITRPLSPSTGKLLNQKQFLPNTELYNLCHHFITSLRDTSISREVNVSDILLGYNCNKNVPFLRLYSWRQEKKCLFRDYVKHLYYINIPGLLSEAKPNQVDK